MVYNIFVYHNQNKLKTKKKSHLAIHTISVILKLYLPSAAAAPPSVSDLTKIPSFSTPVSVPTPRPIILNPSPLSSENKTQQILWPKLEDREQKQTF